MIIVKCAKCGKDIPESDLFVTDDGKVTKVCVECAEVIINKRLKVKQMKEPRFILCGRCGRRRLWPVDFAPGSDLCIRCSTYGIRVKKNTEAHAKSVMDWRKKNPDKYAEHKKRNRERKAAARAEYSEELMKRNRLVQKRYREKQKYLKEMEKIRKEKMKKILEME